MNPPLNRGALAVALAACCMITVQAQSHAINTAQLLSGGTRCDNVIHMMHRHGVNNSVDRVLSNSMLHHSAWGSMVIPANELGDLEVVNVTQLVHEDPACGPKIAVVVQNQSIREVCNFHVTAVAVLGRICPTSPNATVRVEKIGPGEAIEVQVQLPIEALAMGNRNGQIIGFQSLVVAVDSFDELVETNEANNLKAFDRSSLELVSPVVEETVESVSVGTQATGVATVTPTANVNGGTSESLQSPPADDLQSAIRKLGADQSEVVEATNSL